MLWSGAFGRFTYAEDAPAVTADTVYDLASLTKVMATTSRAMQAVEAGALSLDARVTAHLPGWRGSDRASVTVADLLEHASGLTAYLPFFRDHQGRAEFERAICTMPLEYEPGTRSIYSDLGFILLGFILEDVGFGLVNFRLKAEATGADDARGFRLKAEATGADDAGAFRLKAEATGADDARGFRLKAEATGAEATGAEATGAEATGADTSDSRSFRLQAEHPLLFNPPRTWKERCAPTELDLWRGRLLQGEVHDENAWALGGVAGHAGMFGTAAAVGSFAREVLKGLRGLATFARPDTFARFAQKSTVPGSSRALGWDTMRPTSSCGTQFTARALGHTGFTGTSLWLDPQLDLYVVLLTNRVHPSRENNAIQSARRKLHDCLVQTASGSATS